MQRTVFSMLAKLTILDMAAPLNLDIHYGIGIFEETLEEIS